MVSDPLPQDEASESPKQLKGLGLSDLEQHISQQISRLSKEVSKGTLDLQAQDTDKELSLESFVPAFGSLTNLNLPFRDDHQVSSRLSHVDMGRSYQESAELLSNIHDLSDLVTDTIRQLGIRLNSVEEKITLTSEETKAELRTVLKEVRNLLTNTTKADLLTGSDAPLLAELTRHILTLETRLDKDRGELKQKVDEQTGGLRDCLDDKFQQLESLAQQTQDYLGRHFFSLAILLVISSFIAGALVTNSLDRMASYLTQSIDTLRTELGELTLPQTRESRSLR